LALKLTEDLLRPPRPLRKPAISLTVLTKSKNLKTLGKLRKTADGLEKVNSFKSRFIRTRTISLDFMVNIS
jgi:hypothetical protein